jgi:two-component system, cell cycle response regulator
MCDVDHFKLYNDTYGHLAGDDCLRSVAAALTASIKRSADLVARYGGEEFVVVLPRTEGPGALQLAEIIRTTVLERKISHHRSSASSYVTLSLGVASHVPDLGGSPEVLIHAADRALYQAKKNGRNQAVFNPSVA